MSRQDDLIEANNRGLLTGQLKDDFDIAVERGIITLPYIDEPEVEIQPEPLMSPEVEEISGVDTQQKISRTMQNIGQVYPAVETGLNLITSAYGIPASGLGGLATLFATGDLEKANKAIKKIQEGLVYLPKTERGEELTETVSYPFEKLEQGAEFVGGKIEEGGYPNVAAGVHTAISASPVLVGGKAMIKKPMLNISRDMSIAIKKGINKAIRPSIAKKSTSSQVQKYFKQSESAVKEIVKNKDNLNLIDETGAKVEGLPKTLDQFSQAIEHTKKNIFEEYDALSKETGAASKKRDITYPLEMKKGEKIVFNESGKGQIATPIKIDLDATASKLNPVLKNKTFKDFSPETIEYAKMRIESLKGRGKYSAIETQEAIQMLNQTLEQFYRDPSPKMKGRAFVDAVIANNLRKQLDLVIQKTTGKEYQGLKNKYGDLRAIENDVTKRSIVDARKNNKGLIDFTDIFSGHQIIKGMMTKDPASMAGGVAVKGISRYYKMLNDPNKIVKNMFSDVEKLTTKIEQTKAVGIQDINFKEITKAILDRYKMGDFSQRQIQAFDELKKRGLFKDNQQEKP